MQAGFAFLTDPPRTISNLERQSSDMTLLRLIAAGDEGALKVLFARHNVLIHRFVLRLTDDACLAEDVVSEVFIDVWRRPESFRSESRVSTWLFAIARHKTKTARRRLSALPWDEGMASLIKDPADDPVQSLVKQERDELLQNCLRRLGPIHREVIDLVYYQGKSIEEVADIVGIPLGTVKTRMFHARCRMAGFLKRAGINSVFN